MAVRLSRVPSPEPDNTPFCDIYKEKSKIVYSLFLTYGAIAEHNRTATEAASTLSCVRQTNQRTHREVVLKATHPSQHVRCVHDLRNWTIWTPPDAPTPSYPVEGLVDRLVCGGSSPLGRTDRTRCRKWQRPSLWAQYLVHFAAKHGRIDRRVAVQLRLHLFVQLAKPRPLYESPLDHRANVFQVLNKSTLDL